VSSGSDPAKGPEDQDRIVIRDNRKIDPVTGEARKPAAGGADASPAPGEPTPSPEENVPKAEALLLEERTRDLQRVQAEYANYRKRAERDRLAAGELAVGRTLAELLPVIDDLDRARAHGDLTGPLKAVADKLEAAFTKLGLQAFGEVGDPFDPAIHEAVTHDESDTVTVPTCTTVMRQGYKHHDRLLRPAMVGVTDPTVFTQVTEDGQPVTDPEATAHGDPTTQGEPGNTNAQPHEDEVPAEHQKEAPTAE
jgi:molecular chaperone GrpE